MVKRPAPRSSCCCRIHCGGFSKKLENFAAGMALNFAYNSSCKIHRAVRMTPAMAAGIEKSIWTVGDLLNASGE
jgi:hypothetical protein